MRTLIVILISIMLSACSKPSDNGSAEFDNTFYHYTETVNEIVIYKMQFFPVSKAQFIKAVYSKSTGITTAQSSDQKCLTYNLMADNTAIIIGLPAYPNGENPSTKLFQNKISFAAYPDSTFPLMVESLSRDSDKKEFINSLSTQGIVTCE